MQGITLNQTTFKLDENQQMVLASYQHIDKISDVSSWSHGQFLGIKSYLFLIGEWRKKLLALKYTVLADLHVQRISYAAAECIVKHIPCLIFLDNFKLWYSIPGCQLGFLSIISILRRRCVNCESVTVVVASVRPVDFYSFTRIDHNWVHTTSNLSLDDALDANVCTYEAENRT